jgi:hypothetical protein
MLAFLTHTHPKPTPAVSASAKWTPGTSGDGKIVVTIPQVPSTASEAVKLHFRFRAQIKRGNALDSIVWVDKEFPTTGTAKSKEAPIRTNEEMLATSSQPRQITLTVPPSGGGETALNSLLMTLTRAEDTSLKAPESVSVAVSQ